MSPTGSLAVPGDLNGVQTVNATTLKGSTATVSGTLTAGLVTTPRMTSNAVVVNGNNVVTENMKIWIEKQNSKTFLNATQQFGNEGEQGWESTPYYRTPTVDSDSELQIWITSPNG